MDEEGMAQICRSSVSHGQGFGTPAGVSESVVDHLP
jgi:hypothetical protein